MNKQILAALEIANHEVRLVVGQFFNSRLNILKVERVLHSGVKSQAIYDEKSVVEAIKKAVTNVSRNLGIVIERVLLVVPSAHSQRIHNQVKISIVGQIDEYDIRRAYEELLKSKAPEGSVLVNAMISKYFVNGSSTRKIPLLEKSDSLTVEAECYFGNKESIFSYVTCVEKSGLQVIDIILDDLAVAKEASLFEASVQNPIVVFTLNEQQTGLSLYHQGVLMASDYDDTGMKTFIESLQEDFNLPHEVVRRLLYHNVNLDEMNPKDNPIFLWSTKTNSYTISERDLLSSIGDALREFMIELCERSEPILELGTPEILLMGSGADIQGLTHVIENHQGLKAQVYRPTTFGIRDVSFSAVAGSFYYYKDMEVYREQSQASVSEEAFKSVVLKLDYQDDEEETITKKLRHLFFD